MTIKVILQNDHPDPSIPSQEAFQKWVDGVFQHIHNRIHENVKDVCIRIVDIKESEELNRKFRQKEGATNVLSFPNEIEDEQDTSLGDIAICAELVAYEAEEEDASIENHWTHLTVHGILHLLGYDHTNDEDAEEMESIEVEILKSLGVPNPYKDEDFLDDL